MEKKKILLVDDEESFTRMVRLNLEGTGQYEVMTENKGTQALNTARAFKPDLIIMDIIMPDLEGSEVARQVKADPLLKDTPIVFLTATITPDEVKGAGGIIGGQNFIAKPATLRQIVGAIEGAFKKKS